MLQKGQGQISDRTYINCYGYRDIARVHNSLLHFDYHIGYRTHCGRNLCYQAKISFRLGSQTELFNYFADRKVMGFMQVVVVKAPKMLRGILRMMFKMKKPQEF